MSRHSNHALCGFLAGLLVVVGTISQSTVSVYLPGYRDSDWRALRGSIVSSVSVPARVPERGLTLCGTMT